VTLTLTVHRGTQQIGGTCIELRHSNGERLILDAGRPLDAASGATGLLPETLDLGGMATVLICHPHQDHWGLIDELPLFWPIWTGRASAALIEITVRFARQPLPQVLLAWEAGKPFEIGAFRITPILTDHSAFDAYMLLIEADGKRLLYSGDFRRHGRKSALVDQVMQTSLGDLDLLIMEGTNLGTDKPAYSESKLEEEFLALFRSTKERVFVNWSGQNIDRTVTLYRAAKRDGRALVIDLYTAEVLEAVAEGNRLPRAGFPNLKVVITKGLRNHYMNAGRGDFVKRMAAYGISADKIEGNRDVVMMRDGLVHDYREKGLVPTDQDAFNYSQWRGYLDKPCEGLEWCRAAGSKIAHLHTSGHASSADLRAFAAAMNARTIVPVHGINWDTQSEGFGAIKRMSDGVPSEI
jgi:ribonuclease J